MMDPKRWTEPDADSSQLERELVSAGQSVGLPRQQKQRIWAAITQAAVPISPPTRPGLEGGASAATAAAALAQLPAVKLVLALAALGALSSGAYWALRGSPGAAGHALQQTAAVTALSSDAAPVQSVAPEPNAEQGEEAAAQGRTDGPTAAATSVAVPNPGSTQLRETQLREESLSVLEVRRVLRAGDAASALGLLERARVRFPHPVLGQEREALTIEALARSGAGDVAQRRASAFLRAYPKSPYAADVRAFMAR